MFFEFCSVSLRSESMPRVSVEQALDELLAVVPNHASRKLDLAKADVLVHLLRIFCVEGTPAAAHLEEQHS